mmetsp:Transcript_34644/g.89860  ORF Transcript_34644/g.89860 Transcript_34644/m.89860 type:complete len:218 (+) Transcript_34644:3414-4067(+)
MSGILGMIRDFFLPRRPAKKSRTKGHPSRKSNVQNGGNSTVYKQTSDVLPSNSSAPPGESVHATADNSRATLQKKNATRVEGDGGSSPAGEEKGGKEKPKELHTAAKKGGGSGSSDIFKNLAQKIRTIDSNHTRLQVQLKELRQHCDASITAAEESVRKEMGVRMSELDAKLGEVSAQLQAWQERRKDNANASRREAIILSTVVFCVCFFLVRIFKL